ncbi:MAG: DUF4271 domain-containing protein, partial [Prolixibacteraceae bacterium]
MLLPSNSLLAVLKTKTGQAPLKGAKAASQKSTAKKQLTTNSSAQTSKKLTTKAPTQKLKEQGAKKSVQNSKQQTGKASVQSVKPQSAKTVTQNIKLQTSRPAPKTDYQLREEDAIIRAAEQYHQQITGKKTESVSVVKKDVAAGKKTDVAVGKNAEADRELSANIFTGNPGIYQTEGDTLNFWSLTPVPIDSISLVKTIVEQPAKPYGFDGKPMKSVGQDWTFFMVLIGWTFFASLRFGFSKYMVQVFQSIVNFSAASRLYREGGYSNNLGLFRLNVIFYLFLPFPIYLIARDNGMSMGSTGIELFLLVFVAANAYFMIKILIYKLLGSVFSQRETTGELVFNMMLYHNVLGLILLPVATIHSLVPGFGIFSMFIVPSLIVIFYLMSIIRSIYFAARVGISIFYLILYLCALEILPILLV